MRSFRSETTETYTRQMQPAVDSILTDMEGYAREHDVPIAARDVARFQAMLVETTGADRVLEIGTAIGYTAIQLARAGADVVTLERDEDRIAAAEEFIADAGVGDSIDIEAGDATAVLPTLDGQFDLVFVDAKKDEYGAYLDASVPLLRPNGLLVVDNLLWGGRVPAAAVGDRSPDPETEALLEFNERFTSHPRLQAIILPVADGTGFAVKSE